ncbi:tetratricopeptide repeat protein [Rufibacter roseus]|uniref:Tetratricopeptide repeat protein n=2 Tax=Rufibacter roseus TaxID=1567108 RepID=A0ABW2DT57_9BACT|nr:tetratricopeptide repeat protein [Rufibacter roseus]
MFSPQKVESSVAIHIAEITRAIDRNNDHPEWYLKRARLYLASNKIEAAYNDLKTATAKDPALGEAYFQMAKILLARQEYQEAMKMMMQAKAFNYYTPESEAVLAETYVGLEMYDRALNHSSRAIKLRPGEAKYYVLLAKSQSGTGDTARALFNLNRALQRDSLSLPAFRELSAIYTARKQFDEAFPMVQHGIKIQPQDGFWWQQLGQYFLNHRQIDTALVSFNRAIELEPEYAEAFVGLAESWYRKRQYGLALENFLKAQELGHELNEHTRWLLATSYEWTGNRETARQHYIFLTQKYPENPRYRVALQRVSMPIRRPMLDSLSTRSVF